MAAIFAVALAFTQGSCQWSRDRPRLAEPPAVGTAPLPMGSHTSLPAAGASGPASLRGGGVGVQNRDVVAPASSASASLTVASAHTTPQPTTVAKPLLFRNLVASLVDHIDRIPRHPALVAEHHALCARHTIGPDECEALATPFFRARMLFEATRDGGFWRLRWAITDQPPSSRRIWAQWQKASSFFGPPTATAECDEISALFGFLAREMGIHSVGLFYPTWNHTIAAYSPDVIRDRKKRHVTRILIPTTQIFLACDAGFDQTTFDSLAQPVFEYPFHDVAESATISGPVCDFLLGQVDVYGQASPELLELLRLHRAARFDSSTGDCTVRRRALSARLLTSGITKADMAALEHYFARELGQVVATSEQAMTVLESV